MLQLISSPTSLVTDPVLKGIAHFAYIQEKELEGVSEIAHFNLEWGEQSAVTTQRQGEC